MPVELEPLLANVHEEVRSKYYGCGIVVPAALKARACSISAQARGATSIMMAQLVDSNGEVVGIDMTDEQLATANAQRSWSSLV